MTVLPLFVTGIFSGALLLFVVEPMVAKMLLPLAGGTPAVWTTAVLFFQALLLAGYGYTHGLTRWLSPRVQGLVHLAVMLLPLIALPIAIREPGPPPAGGNPVIWLLVVLVLTAGLPFLVVSTTSPLLQRWFSWTRHEEAGDPYFLYQASNLGSLIALVAYPFAIEARLGLAAQSRSWEIGYLLLLALAAGAVLALWRSVSHAAPRKAPEAAAMPLLGNRRRLRWVVLAAIPSTWLLGVTAYFTTTVRPLPLLWVVPLALYLLSFAIVFGRRRLVAPWLLQRAFPFLVLPLLGLVLMRGGGPFWFQALLHFGVFFVGSLICHGLIADDRPPPEQLTQFYVWIAVGGALGGLFSAVIAPVLLSDFYEYPIAIVAACFVLPSLDPRQSRRLLVRDLGFPVLVLAGILLVFVAGATSGVLPVLGRIELTAGATAADLARLLVVYSVPAMLAVAFSRRALRFGGATAAMLIASLLPIGSQGEILFQTRDFFGVHAVITDPARTRHLLVDGITIHGVQLLDEQGRREPESYYARSGPAGDVFDLARNGSAWNVGVVGLGAGSLSCLSQPDQHWTYYEIDPAMAAIARDPRYFTYLRDCPAAGTRVVLGDGRLTLASAGPASYDVIVIDAFGSDAIPVHLLTREAIRLYRSRLAPGGMILFNISNRYVNLTPVLAAEAADAGLVALERVDSAISPADSRRGKFPSDWLLMTEPGTQGISLSGVSGWVRPATDPALRLWTDDYSNVLSVTRFG